MFFNETITRLQAMPDGYIDCSFRQGHAAVLRQLRQRDTAADATAASAAIDAMRETVNRVKQRVAPYILPEDYLFFLEHYGGLLIDGADYNLMVFGVGPMGEDWYPSLESDDVVFPSSTLGVLSIGMLSFATTQRDQSQAVTFLLDLSGTVQPYTIIGVGSWDRGNLTLAERVTHVNTYPDTWKKVASSFTDWLDLIAMANGTCGYT